MVNLIFSLILIRINLLYNYIFIMKNKICKYKIVYLIKKWNYLFFIEKNVKVMNMYIVLG